MHWIHIHLPTKQTLSVEIHLECLNIGEGPTHIRFMSEKPIAVAAALGMLNQSRIPFHLEIDGVETQPMIAQNIQMYGRYLNIRALWE